MSNELLFVAQQKTCKPKLLNEYTNQSINEYTRVNSACRKAPDTWGYAVRPMLQRWRMRPDGTIQLMGPGCRSKQHRLYLAIPYYVKRLHILRWLNCRATEDSLEEHTCEICIRRLCNASVSLTPQRQGMGNNTVLSCISAVLCKAWLLILKSLLLRLP